MFKKVGTAIIGLGLALGTAACAGDAQPERAVVTVTEQANGGSSSQGDLFLEVLRDNTNEWDNLPDEHVINLAGTMCDTWDAGATFEQIGLTLINAGFEVYDAGFFIGVGTEAFCPEHSDKVDSGPTT